MAAKMQNPELKPFFTTRGMEYSYVLGKFLSVNESFDMLSAMDKNSLTEARMLEILRNVRCHHFQHMQVSFPVNNIKHVTEKMALEGICSDEGFKITKFEPMSEFRDLSYWSPDISSGDLKRARKRACKKASKVIGSKVPKDLKQQFGNSSAFKEFASCFGNFKFSFPLSYLLDVYKDQHCEGEKPQLRILGTVLYRMKISHVIVVHSPGTQEFNDFPEVPTVQGSSASLPHVYWMDGTLFWRPESTSYTLKATISEDGFVSRECYKPCPWFIKDGTCYHLEKGIYSVWNDLTVAFHLPNGPLKIPEEKLVRNLTACSAVEVYLGEKKLSIEEAEEIVQELKDKE